MREFAHFCMQALIYGAERNARALFMNALAPAALKYAANDKILRTQS